MCPCSNSILFRHQHAFFFNKGENWFAALTNIAILKTQNYCREMKIWKIYTVYFQYLIVRYKIKSNIVGIFSGTPELGGRKSSCPPCLLLGGTSGAKVPFKCKEYYITVSFQGVFS